MQRLSVRRNTSQTDQAGKYFLLTFERAFFGLAGQGGQGVRGCSPKGYKHKYNKNKQAKNKNEKLTKTKAKQKN